MTEDQLEQEALSWLDYSVLYGADIAPGQEEALALILRQAETLAAAKILITPNATDQHFINIILNLVNE